MRRHAPASAPARMSRLEAHQILFRGQSNVRLMATELGCTLEDLQASFRAYVAKNPVDDNVWQGDIELGWPWI